MKKWIFSLALMHSVTAQNATVQKMIHHDHEFAPKQFKSTEVGYQLPTEVEAGYLDVKAMQVRGFSGESAIKLEAALELLEKVVNSEEFKDRVINFKNTKGERKFASNNGMTNEEIYQAFMEGRETLQPETPGEMNFFISLYNKPWSRVIGYTDGTTNVINVNWKFFRNFEPYEVASNLAHEWIHKIGFDHASAREHDSAPYAIGYLVEDIGSRLLKKTKLH